MPVPFLSQALRRDFGAATAAPDAERDRASWLSGLQAGDLHELYESALTAGLPPLAGRWPELSEAEKSAIAAVIAAQTQSYEMTRILARLAEVLQTRVLKLENELARREALAAAE